MEIISHRGFWKEPAEKNQRIAFERSFSLNFGTETDLRDQGGNVVICHDPPTDECLSLEELLEMHAQMAPGTTLALNVKADGLWRMVKQSLDRFQTSNAFVFDMSIPDTLGYISSGVPVYSRLSEYEPMAAFESESAGVWLDGFKGEWYTKDIIEAEIARGKRVCIVSPELHRRDPRPLWTRMRSWALNESESCLLCTDLPEEARRFFDGKD